MFLYKDTYVLNSKHTKPERRHAITVLQGGLAHEGIKSDRIAFVVEEVAYWRKANAIHAWFVDNVQEGQDECQRSYVSRENLERLRNTIADVLSRIQTAPGPVYASTTWDHDGRHDYYKEGQVIVDPSEAAARLPTREGFFFGKTDYDEDYVSQLRRTHEILSRLLAEPGTDGEFYYHASW